jgi:hypothetical protein
MEENQRNKVAEANIQEKKEIELTNTTENKELTEKKETAEKDYSAADKIENVPQKEEESNENKETIPEYNLENERKKLMLSYDTQENREICTFYTSFY